MIQEYLTNISDWGSLDTWIASTAALAAMACALPGNFLVLRRQSMMGDALSHTVLPGVVVSFLVAHRILAANWITASQYQTLFHFALFGGAVAIGVLSALLTEWVRKLGNVEASAALGVVFTTFFAIGLLLIRIAADQVHIDPDCVLYGTIETVVMDTLGGTDIPRAAVSNGAVLLVNLLLLFVFYKELKISTFDPALATTLGINSNLIHYALMAVTAGTLVAAFESVGSILVIAMLIAPAATAYLLSERLWVMIGLSLIVAASSAFLGHMVAITIPSIVFARIGFPTVDDASTAGMMAVASGVIFVAAVLLAPRHGLLSRLVHQNVLGLRISCEDVLGLLYRAEEAGSYLNQQALREALVGWSKLRSWAVVLLLKLKRQMVLDQTTVKLTDVGRGVAKGLVRSHRLWESYMARHFPLPEDHLHDTASRVEHYIGKDIREMLEQELDTPAQDPHGREIPGE